MGATSDFDKLRLSVERRIDRMRACLKTCYLIVFFVVCSGSLLPQQPPKNAFAPLQFLLGNWVGEGGGVPGQATGSFSFAADLQGTVVVRKSYAEYPATKDKPAYRHDDLMVIYADTTNNQLRAIFFDNEGHTINYSIRAAADGSSIEFLSEAQGQSPRFRFAYQKAGTDAVKLKFEIAPPGKPEAFQTYIEATAHRQKIDR
jgi:hypothetical protein